MSIWTKYRGGLWWWWVNGGRQEGALKVDKRNILSKEPHTPSFVCIIALSLPLPPSLPPSHPLSLPPSLSLTHTHTLSLSLSLSPSPSSLSHTVHLPICLCRCLQTKFPGETSESVMNIPIPHTRTATSLSPRLREKKIALKKNHLKKFFPS